MSKDIPQVGPLQWGRVTVAEAAVPIDRECRVVRYGVIQIEAAKPAVSKMQFDFLADKLEKVLEPWGRPSTRSLVVRREEGGKIRVTSSFWEEAKVIGRNEVLEVRNVDGRLHVARKVRRPDEWDPPIAPYDP